MCQHYDELPMVTELCYLDVQGEQQPLQISSLWSLPEADRRQIFFLPWKISCRFSLGEKKIALYTKEENSVNSEESDKEMKMRVELHGPEPSE